MKKLPFRVLGGTPAFRYYYNPYEGESIACPLCGKTAAAGLETCPECGRPIPGQQRSRKKLWTSPLTVLMALIFLALLGLGIYFFVREMLSSGFIALLLAG